MMMMMMISDDQRPTTKWQWHSYGFFLRKSNWNKLVKEPFFYFVACFQNYMYIILHKKITSMLWWLLLLSNYDCCCRCCCCINFYLWNCRFGFGFFFLVKVFFLPPFYCNATVGHYISIENIGHKHSANSFQPFFFMMKHDTTANIFQIDGFSFHCMWIII